MKAPSDGNGDKGPKAGGTLKRGSKLEGHLKRVESAYGLTAPGAGLPLERGPRAEAPAGLAQSKHSGPLDGAIGLEARVHEVDNAAGAPASGKSRGLSVTARVWIAVGAAGLLWALLTGLLVLIADRKS